MPGLIIWRAGCAPLFGLRKVESAATPAQNTACTQANLQIQQSFTRLQSLETVLLVGRWAYYVSGTGVGLDAENVIDIHPTDGAERLTLTQPQLISSAARETVTFLNERFENVYVLRQPPEIAQYSAQLAAREAAHQGMALAATPKTEPVMSRDTLALRAAISDAPWLPLAEAGAIHWIDSWPRFCTADTCSAIHDDIGQYFDNNHITNSAARRVRDLFTPVFASVTRQSALVETAGQ